ncbi:MAG: enoyl-CoA hydratase [Actinobacteria bacterium]|nr:enoyl-CoA hydratase [Actinomycetota bacterium]
MVDYLTLERSDGVATITIDRPEVRNAITAPGWTGLHDLFDEVARDDSVRVLVITGAGEDFCSGADVGGDPRDREGHPLDGMRSVGRACQTLHTLPKPTIARVDGVAAGAGLNMALACDFVLASDRSRFSEIFARRGLNIDFGGSFILPRIVGMQKAKELVLLADILDAERAEEMGLVNRVVPQSELDTVVEEFVSKLKAGPPIALASSQGHRGLPQHRFRKGICAHPQGRSRDPRRHGIALVLQRRLRAPQGHRGDQVAARHDPRPPHLRSDVPESADGRRRCV